MEGSNLSYVLLVDDEDDILDVLELVVQTVTTHKVVKAYSGHQALDEISRSGKPSLVVSDYSMPNGDGLFLYRELLVIGPDVPFILCTANPKDQLKEFFPNLNRFIQKPYMM